MSPIVNESRERVKKERVSELYFNLFVKPIRKAFLNLDSMRLRIKSNISLAQEDSPEDLTKNFEVYFTELLSGEEIVNYLICFSYENSKVGENKLFVLRKVPISKLMEFSEKISSSIDSCPSISLDDFQVTKLNDEKKDGEEFLIDWAERYIEGTIKDDAPLEIALIYGKNCQIDVFLPVCIQNAFPATEDSLDCTEGLRVKLD